MKSILITGAAGFIGYHLSKRLLAENYQVYGLDNLNEYYDIKLKQGRLDELKSYPNFWFENINLADRHQLTTFFDKYVFTEIVHLAAQAGVRYSLTNPEAYVESNLVGFANLLHCIQQHKIQHCVYASTSSVYGANQKYPFSEEDPTDHPVSFYAATKKSNEVMAHSYAGLYGIPMTGLRFFTVYGPWGRPDMALFTFTKKILAQEPIEIFNHGELFRDFTYIDDIVTGLCKIIPSAPRKSTPHEIYNIGCGTPVKLTDFIDELERQLGIRAERISVDMQKGDMYKTFADTSKLKQDFGYQPSIGLKEGIGNFLTWYSTYYSI